METEPGTVQTNGRMQIVTKDVFFIPDEELKDFYLKFAYLLNPNASSIHHSDFVRLKILHKDLKSILTALSKVTQHSWDEGMQEIQTACGIYSVEDKIDKKERIKMNATVGKHLQFLTQMAIYNSTLKRIFSEYTRHYENVEHLIKQCPENQEYS